MNLSFFNRKKKFDSVNVEQTNFSRVLSLFDITALGISCTLGAGIYILTTDVISKYAGPGIILSFLVAGIATFCAGLSYSELGARVPRAGSAYIYIYVTIGEFVAFVMGWDLILEYLIGTASTASALSNYVDAITGYKIKSWLALHVPINVSGLGPYPDVVAFVLVLAVTAMLIIGVKESTTMNNFICGFNLIMLAFIAVLGLTAADFNNWNIKISPNLNWTDPMTHQNQTCANNAAKCGTGGFLPFGFAGVLRGAAKCFYAFIGFDCIASTGEEVSNPKRTLPLGIITTLVVVSVCYCGTAAVLSLMMPYYIINPELPIPQAFNYVHLHWAKEVLSVGAIASIAACLYGSIFPVPRIIYSMASDGLIFECLSKVLPKLKTPINAIIFAGFLSASLALIFDLNQLIDMMSIGTLMAYSLVSMCVLILRFRPDEYEELNSGNMHGRVVTLLLGESEQSICQRLFFPSGMCSKSTSRVVNVVTILGVLDIIAIVGMVYFSESLLGAATLTCLILASCLMCTILFVISRQPENKQINSFKVPCITVVPFISITMNTYLMMTLSSPTWIRFGVWFLLGILVYFAYGIRYSKENDSRSKHHGCFPCAKRFNEVTDQNNVESMQLKDAKQAQLMLTTMITTTAMTAETTPQSTIADREPDSSKL